MRHSALCQCCGEPYTFGAVFRPRCIFCSDCRELCRPGVPSYVEQVDAWAMKNLSRETTELAAQEEDRSMVATATDLASTPYWSQPEPFARLISEALARSTRNPDAAEPRLAAMARELPSGSGIDSGTTIARDLDGTAGLDTGVSFDQVFVLDSSWHAMDSNGYYAGWFDFRVVVESTFAGPTVAIVWADGKSPEQDYPEEDENAEWAGVSDPTDYLVDVYSEAMREQHARIEFDDPPA